LVARSGQQAVQPLPPAYAIALVYGDNTMGHPAPSLNAAYAVDELRSGIPLCTIEIAGHRCAPGMLVAVPDHGGRLREYGCVRTWTWGGENEVVLVR